MRDKRWKFLGRCSKGGMKFFMDGDAIAIADNSGDWPEDTDDGILIINKEAPLMIRATSRALVLDLRVFKESAGVLDREHEYGAGCEVAGGLRVLADRGFKVGLDQGIEESFKVIAGVAKPAFTPVGDVLERLCSAGASHG